MQSRRILLVNPWIYDFACYDLFAKPLGLLQFAAYFAQEGFTVDLVDCLDRLHPCLCELFPSLRKSDTAAGRGKYHSEIVRKPDVFMDIPRRYRRYGMPPDVFERIIQKTGSPRAILVSSGMTFWYEGVFEAIAILKKTFPGVPIILGGIYASLCHAHAARLSGADFVFKGACMNEALLFLSKILPFSFNAHAHAPRPAYELYRTLEYVTLRTSNGCPFRCSYCGWHVLDAEFSQRDHRLVRDEIEYFYRALGVRDFAFYDEALLYNVEGHLIPLLEALREKGVRARFHTPSGLHARFITKRVAEHLKKSNFTQPRLGFESVDATRQTTTGGKVTNEELVRAVRVLKESGYAASEIGVYLLIGLPEQSYEEVERSLYFAHTLGVRVYLEQYSPVPGTRDYERAGFSEKDDPLLHNNAAFPLYGASRFKEFQVLKDLNHRLNERHRP
jgi:hypothetical protein